jgi:hypothetical protein
MKIGCVPAGLLTGQKWIAPAAARRWQRTAVLWLVLCLVAFGFETALHSIHHLSEPRKAAECQTLSASKHLMGAPVDISTVTVIFHATTAALFLRQDPFRPGFPSPTQGRAPPSLSA